MSFPRKGVRLAIASGRPPFAMEQSLLEQVKFDYFVCSNGAFVRNAQHEVLYHYSFTMEETLKLIRAFKRTDNALCSSVRMRHIAITATSALRICSRIF